MQPLPETTNSHAVRECAHELLDTVPPVMWFIRRQTRVFRKGLSLPQFQALSMVNREPSASLSAVADHLNVTMPTASRIVSSLVTKGFVTRVGCLQDRRQMSLEITPKGLDVLLAGWAGTECRLVEQLRELDPAQMDHVREAMRVLKRVFGSLGLPDGGPTAAHRPAAARRGGGAKVVA